MFDTMLIAKRIKQARIDQNMTQLQLADLMGVSYQAVSNWERGNSMPDISKLEDLCNVLNLEISELLGVERKVADAVEKVLEKKTLTMEELVEVAPMLPPEQLQEQARKASAKKVDFSKIISLAPFLDEEYLSELVEKVEPDNLREVICVAPFLSTSCLRGLISRCQSADDFDMIISLAPFLDRETLDALVNRCEAEADSAMLCSLAPFVSTQTLDSLVDRLLAKGGEAELDCVSSLAPFLSSTTLRKVAEKMMEDRNLEGLADIATFL